MYRHRARSSFWDHVTSNQMYPVEISSFSFIFISIVVEMMVKDGDGGGTSFDDSRWTRFLKLFKMRRIDIYPPSVKPAYRLIFLQVRASERKSERMKMEGIWYVSSSVFLFVASNRLFWTPSRPPLLFSTISRVALASLSLSDWMPCRFLLIFCNPLGWLYRFFLLSFHLHTCRWMTTTRQEMKTYSIGLFSIGFYSRLSVLVQLSVCIGSSRIIIVAATGNKIAESRYFLWYTDPLTSSLACPITWTLPIDSDFAYCCVNPRQSFYLQVDSSKSMHYLNVTKKDERNGKKNCYSRVV